MNAQSLWIVLFCFALYFIVTDNSIAQAFDYVIKIIKNKFSIKLWWLMNNPRNPIVKYLMWRRSVKMAEELQQELEKLKKTK
jgi:hypothetical protein